jgi:misacylated tRNA(Ala) deacylase
MSGESDPRMHSAEHILNATMVRLVGSPRAFSAHLDGPKGKADYRFPRDLSESEAASVQEAVNAVIAAGHPVSESFLSRAEAATRFDLSRLPEGTGEELRVISVGDYDACPCSGRHVANTREIGGFRIVGHEQKDGVLRIRFRLDSRVSEAEAKR